jgi:NADPH-dependent 7-cyano-7-deazaguanine reductase QueF
MSSWLEQWNKQGLVKSYQQCIRFHQMCIKEAEQKLKELSKNEELNIVLSE